MNYAINVLTKTKKREEPEEHAFLVGMVAIILPLSVFEFKSRCDCAFALKADRIGNSKK